MDTASLEERINYYLLRDNYVKVKNLAVDFCVSENTINYWLKRLNYRERDIFTQLPKNYIKAFEILNEETSYWLGYLQADGCIYIDKKLRKRLILECEEKDKEILENFCNFTKINKRRIKNRTHYNESGKISHSVRLDLYSGNFSVFPDVWIRPNKSYLDCEIPQEVSFYNYLLGLLDGDGSVSTSKSGAKISFICRNKMASQIINQLKQDLPIPTSLWIRSHPCTKGLFILSVGTGGFHHLNFKFLYNKFYLDKNFPCLTRKKEKLKNFIIGSL